MANLQLQADPNKRITVQQCLEHEFISGTTHNTLNRTATIANLRKFNAKRKLKGAMRAVRTGMSLFSLARAGSIRKTLSAASVEAASQNAKEQTDMIAELVSGMMPMAPLPKPARAVRLRDLTGGVRIPAFPPTHVPPLPSTLAPHFAQPQPRIRNIWGSSGRTRLGDLRARSPSSPLGPSLADAVFRGITSVSQKQSPSKNLPGLPIEMVLQANRMLINSITTRNWTVYKELVSKTMTCFEPEAEGVLVEGLEFHRFFFDSTCHRTRTRTLCDAMGAACAGVGVDVKPTPIDAEWLKPGPPLPSPLPPLPSRAVGSAVPLAKTTPAPNTTLLNEKCKMLGQSAALVTYVRVVQSMVNGAPQIKKSVESRVWQKVDGKWVNIHFHRTGCKTI